MTSSYTVTETATFTVSHARHLSTKVATDLKRIQRFYDRPSDADIAAYEAEALALIREGFLGCMTYGFQRDGLWIPPTLRFTARNLAGGTAEDDDPGRILPGANTTNAVFCSYLVWSDVWHRLTDAQKKAFLELLPFQRSGAPEPSINGYLQVDRTYSAGGRALDRASVRPY